MCIRDRPLTSRRAPIPSRRGDICSRRGGVLHRRTERHPRDGKDSLPERTGPLRERILALLERIGALAEARTSAEVGAFPAAELVGEALPYSPLGQDDVVDGALEPYERHVTAQAVRPRGETGDVEDGVDAQQLVGPAAPEVAPGRRHHEDRAVDVEPVSYTHLRAHDGREPRRSGGLGRVALELRVVRPR